MVVIRTLLPSKYAPDHIKDTKEILNTKSYNKKKNMHTIDFTLYFFFLSFYKL